MAHMIVLHRMGLIQKADNPVLTIIQSLKNKFKSLQCDVIMARCRLKSPASPLFTQPYWGADQENSKASRHWPLCGNSPVTGEFPAQIASNAENVSIWWRHHVESSIADLSLYQSSVFVNRANRSTDVTSANTLNDMLSVSIEFISVFMGLWWRLLWSMIRLSYMACFITKSI